jgi:DNA-binding NarL/FixJ family response regulator
MRINHVGAMNTADAVPITQDPASSAAEALVLAFAQGLPVQLDHWLKHRGMRLEFEPGLPDDPAMIEAKGANYAIVDADTPPAGRAPIDLVRALHTGAPKTRIVVISHRGDETFVRSMLEAGASGVVVKQPYVADLAFAIEAADRGETFVSGITPDKTKNEVTAREHEVLELMADGQTNQAIGARLSISVKTVEAHRARIFKKLGASNVADAIMLAIRAGLVMP